MTSAVYSYILAIEQEKNFSRAAKKLGVSQPALSAAIARTEQSLGCQLMDRTTSPIKLTEAGRAYVEYCRRTQLIEDEFQKSLADINNLDSGSVTVGGSSCFTTSCLSKATAVFLEKYPNINVTSLDGRTPEMAALASSGELDLFITPEDICNNELKMVKLFEERVFICCPQLSLCADRLSEYEVPLQDVFDGSCRTKEYPVVTPKDFENERFILISENQHIRHVAEQFFESQSFVPASMLTVGQMMTSYALTVSGVGVSFITESAVRFGNYANNARLFCPDECFSRRTLCAAYKESGYLSKAAHEYLSVLCSIFDADMNFSAITE